MARKDRKGAAEERLEGLLVAGDWRTARVEASRLAGEPDGPEHDAGLRALERLRPNPSARLALVAGLVFLAVVAAAGLRMR